MKNLPLLVGGYGVAVALIAVLAIALAGGAASSLVSRSSARNL